MGNPELFNPWLINRGTSPFSEDSSLLEGTPPPHPDNMFLCFLQERFDLDPSGVWISLEHLWVCFKVGAEGGFGCPFWCPFQHGATPPPNKKKKLKNKIKIKQKKNTKEETTTCVPFGFTKPWDIPTTKQTHTFRHSPAPGRAPNTLARFPRWRSIAPRASAPASRAEKFREATSRRSCGC